MSNATRFSQASDNVDSFLSAPEAASHAVHFYEADGVLLDAVAKFLAPALDGGEGVLLVATKGHADALVALLEPHGACDAIAQGRLRILDARETLARFMVDEMPDAERFFGVIEEAVGSLRSVRHAARVRAFGEMVDLLWRDGNSRAAIRLEELWNEVRPRHAIALLCACVMGNFYREGDAARFLEVCEKHSHVLPRERTLRSEDRASEVSALRRRAESLENEITDRKELEAALRDALRERARVEEELRAAVQREQEGRAKAEASDAFKEVFLGILAHDLRNPLNTVLTTARVMAMGENLPADMSKKVNRMINSGVRMQRMIDQILDLARARLTDGIPVERGEPRDLAQLVNSVVDEMRAAHPTRTIELVTSASVAPIDADRFEQVVSNLIGNAIVHGAPDGPIRVEVGTRGAVASVRVRNQGTPIDAESLEQLFNPFQRGVRPRPAKGGLGLGLYISERIVTAHGGSIKVDSDERSGTVFEACFPRE
jgi:signal transduction histidine kinase